MTTSYGRGFVGLFKRGWNEIPEVLGSAFMGFVGLGLGLTGMYIYDQKDGDNRKYKLEYTVIRHDDPKANYVRQPREEC